MKSSADTGNNLLQPMPDSGSVVKFTRTPWGCLKCHFVSARECLKGLAFTTQKPHALILIDGFLRAFSGSLLRQGPSKVSCAFARGSTLRCGCANSQRFSCAHIGVSYVRFNQSAVEICQITSFDIHHGYRRISLCRRARTPVRQSHRPSRAHIRNPAPNQPELRDHDRRRTRRRFQQRWL